MRNPFSIKDTVAMNGDDVPSHAVEAAEDFVSLLEATPRRHRVVMLQIVTDFFCPRCGIDQPEGDCQCGKR